ncbi:lysine transporter LysE [Paramagnetospirillum kuznetsovii]|uniref:Lysine transporter LysE n=1 Tax=Paramagnetospirillum kuznetsovii TaxID=2053833 RepID=A0A364NVY0_9PROT|nr:LysE family translocator [Paramagnetospirillum kuznetsovii]RAU21150.1 lysine transporter LysE [Paramagnetospirillum kuznetsovii]
MALELWQATGFLAAAVAVTVSPGPDNMMILSLGIARGRRQGMAFGLGCALGCLSHTALAALGVSALIAASAWAFMGLKICGGVYLVWLGVQAVRSRGGITLSAESAVSPEGLSSLFAKGLVANAINPKVVLFFLAFLPQFVSVEHGGVAWQTAQLGALFTVQAVLLFGAIGYFSGWVGQAFNRSPRTGTWLDRIAGGIFIGLGIKLMATP